MQLYLAADHAGFALKDRIKARLNRAGLEVMDVTPVFKDGDDYPLIAKTLTARMRNKVRGTRYEVRGLLFCGSGVGVCIAANRHEGIRAAVGHTTDEVKLAREHNDINVLCLSGWNYADERQAMKLIDAFLKTKRSSAARHLRRVRQMG